MERVALVTGGNSGIGYATARLLKEREYRVFIAGRNAAGLVHAGQELNVETLTVDLEDANAVRAVASQFFESGLDVLVNSAGIGVFLPIGSYDEANIAQHFNVNVRAPLLLIQELVPALEKNQGSVTTVSSIISNHGAAGAAIYAATKGAVEAFTRSLALELAPRKIRVNAVAPGAIDTPMFSKMGLTAEQIDMVMEGHRTTIPLRRLGSPEEVAQVIVAQAEATYVTGSIWTVDGGVDA